MNTTFQNSLIRSLIGLASIGVLSLFNGCTSYHLGSSAKIPFKSIYIKPATNHSFAPQAQPIVSAQLRETFIHDGRVKIVTKEEDADAILFVDLTEYDRNAASRNSTDTTIVNDFNLRLTASISLFNQSKEDYLFKDRSVEARTNAYVANPYAESEIVVYQQSERQAMAQLAREIARKISDEVLSPW